MNEKWIRVDPKTSKPMKKNGKLVDCGRSKTEVNKKIKKGMCRPYKKITKDTPVGSDTPRAAITPAIPAQ